MTDRAGANPAIGVTGIASLVLGENQTVDATPFLSSRKSRKYMGLQDELAVVATGRALGHAKLRGPLGARTGLFVTVGFIPFREEDIAPVLEASLVDDAFDVRRFGAEGFSRAHPLLTFRCLPNMPAYHMSTNFGVEGPYFVSYPGLPEFYSVLEQAKDALSDGSVDAAIVGAVAAQSNFLVRHHFARLDPPVPASVLKDVAAVVVLERADHARARAAEVLAELRTLEWSGTPNPNPLPPAPSPPAPSTEAPPDGLGPASMLVELAAQIERGEALYTHSLRTPLGLEGRAVWSVFGEARGGRPP